MKGFHNYQYVGGEMSERDKKEVGSKFWNEGKFDNFVRPFLPEEVGELVFTDVGCNAGIFLKQAEDMGFERVVGVDASKHAIKKNHAYRKRVGGKWQILYRDMRNALEDLPVSDYLVMAMTHYYFPIDDWFRFLDQLSAKTAHCIIVTAKKREKLCKAAADTESIRSYFSHWEETGYIPTPSFEGDPYPREQWSFCFKSPSVKRVNIDTLDNGNHVQGGFYEDLDKGIDPHKTRYYRILRGYRLKANPEAPLVWSEDKLEKFIQGKIAVYNDVKENGLREPIIINKVGRILDGNHRCEMWRHLGHKSVLVRQA